MSRHWSRRASRWPWRQERARASSRRALRLEGIFVPLMGLLLLGCGTMCDRAEATATAFAEKAKACGGDPHPRFDRATCQARLDGCTESDLRTVAAYFDCLDALPKCEIGAAASFRAAVLECVAPMPGVSAGCVVP